MCIEKEKLCGGVGAVGKLRWMNENILLIPLTFFCVFVIFKVDKNFFTEVLL